MSAVAEEILTWAKAFLVLWKTAPEGVEPGRLRFQETSEGYGPDGAPVEVRSPVEVEVLPYIARQVATIHMCKDGIINARWDVAQRKASGPYGEAWHQARGREATANLAALREALLARGAAVPVETA